MNLLLFAFKDTSSAQVLKLFNQPNSFFVNSSQAGINQLLKTIQANQPNFILGLGQFSHASTKIKIETRTTNKFRNNFLGPQLEQLSISPFMKESDFFEYSQTIGNSWCNLVSYKIMQLVHDQKINSQYTFLHLSIKLDNQKIVEYLKIELTQFIRSLR